MGASLDDWRLFHACGFVDVFFADGMVLVLWGLGVILGNGYGIWGQNYVALFHWSEALAGFGSMN